MATKFDYDAEAVPCLFQDSPAHCSHLQCINFYQAQTTVELIKVLTDFLRISQTILEVARTNE